MSCELKLVIVDVLGVTRQTWHHDGAMPLLQRLEDTTRAALDDGQTSCAEIFIELTSGEVLMPDRMDARNRWCLSTLDDQALAGMTETVGEPRGAGEGLDVSAENEDDHSNVPA